MVNVGVGRFTTISGENLIGKKSYPIMTNPVEGFTPFPKDFSQAKHDMFLLNFFATWCAPCQKEHPNLIKLSKDYEVHIMGVVTRDSPKRITDYLRENGNPYDYLGVDKMDITAVNYQVKGIPESYLVARDGKVIAFYSGFLSEQVLAEKFIPHLKTRLKLRKKIAPEPTPPAE